MRRALPLLALVSLALAGCGGEKTVSPTPQKVQGTFTLATSTQSTTPAPSSGGGGGGGKAGGGANDGKALFASNGCTGCHTYAKAGSNAKIGPDLDKLAAYAKTAKQPLAQFTKTSIVNPGAYLQPGYANIMPKTYKSLPPAQIAALVTFLTGK